MEFWIVEDRSVLEVPADTIGLVKRMEEVTGFDIELLLFQTLLANQICDIKTITKEVAQNFVSSKVEHTDNSKNQGTGAKLPFWFHLDPNYAKILQKLEKKYENRLTRDQLLELIIRFSINAKTIVKK